jgi:major vault protein
MVNVPPRHYVTIFNPHQRKDGTPVLDASGTVKLAYGDTEIRLTEGWPDPFPLYPGEVHEGWPDPFPLYPGEVHVGGVKGLTVVEKYCALRIRALRDFKDSADEHKAGDVWLFKTPLLPRFFLADTWWWYGGV